MSKWVCMVESTFTNGKIYHEGDVAEFGPTVKVNENWWLEEKFYNQGFRGSNKAYKESLNVKKEEPKKEPVNEPLKK